MGVRMGEISLCSHYCLSSQEVVSIPRSIISILFPTESSVQSLECHRMGGWIGCWEVNEWMSEWIRGWHMSVWKAGNIAHLRVLIQRHEAGDLMPRTT